MDSSGGEPDSKEVKVIGRDSLATSVLHTATSALRNEPTDDENLTRDLGDKISRFVKFVFTHQQLYAGLIMVGLAPVFFRFLSVGGQGHMHVFTFVSLSSLVATVIYAPRIVWKSLHSPAVDAHDEIWADRAKRAILEAVKSWKTYMLVLTALVRVVCLYAAAILAPAIVVSVADFMQTFVIILAIMMLFPAERQRQIDWKTFVSLAGVTIGGVMVLLGANGRSFLALMGDFSIEWIWGFLVGFVSAVAAAIECLCIYRLNATESIQPFLSFLSFSWQQWVVLAISIVMLQILSPIMRFVGIMKLGPTVMAIENPIRFFGTVIGANLILHETPTLFGLIGQIISIAFAHMFTVTHSSYLVRQPAAASSSLLHDSTRADGAISTA